VSSGDTLVGACVVSRRVTSCAARVLTEVSKCHVIAFDVIGAKHDAKVSAFRDASIVVADARDECAALLWPQFSAIVVYDELDEASKQRAPHARLVVLSVIDPTATSQVPRAAACDVTNDARSQQERTTDHVLSNVRDALPQPSNEPASLIVVDMVKQFADIVRAHARRALHLSPVNTAVLTAPASASVVSASSRDDVDIAANAAKKPKLMQQQQQQQLAPPHTPLMAPVVIDVGESPTAPVTTARASASVVDMALEYAPHNAHAVSPPAPSLLAHASPENHRNARPNATADMSSLSFKFDKFAEVLGDSCDRLMCGLARQHRRHCHARARPSSGAPT
jgi:hypothetical protein